MRKPNPLATHAAGGKSGKKAIVSGSETATKNITSHATGDFIPPPTREQLMAGSANLRRVYNIEA